jgi:hypothetical protein
MLDSVLQVDKKGVKENIPAIKDGNYWFDRKGKLSELLLFFFGIQLRAEHPANKTD